MGSPPAQKPLLQTSKDNGDLQPSQSGNSHPIEETRSKSLVVRLKACFNRIKEKCRWGKGAKKPRDLVDETMQNGRTSSSEGASGREPYAYSEHVKGATTSDTSDGPSPARRETTRLANETAAGPQTEHAQGGFNATENDLNDRSRPPHISPSSPVEQIIPVEPSELRTTFKMVFHMQGDRTLTRMFQLDTGSSVNLLSQLVLLDLGMALEPYEGQLIPLGNGERIQPLGKVNLEWHVMGKPKTYKSTFLVLDDKSSEDFDVLLGRETIGRVGFYKTDEKVWVLNQGSR